MLDIDTSAARGRAQQKAAGLLLEGTRVYTRGPIEITAKTPDGRGLPINVIPLAVNNQQDTLLVPIYGQATTVAQLFPKHERNI